MCDQVQGAEEGERDAEAGAGDAGDGAGGAPEQGGGFLFNILYLKKVLYFYFCVVPVPFFSSKKLNFYKENYKKWLYE